MSLFSDAVARLKSFYSTLSAPTPGGMGKGGHRTYLIPAFQDVATAGQGCADYALMAQAAAKQAGSWLQPVEADGETLATVVYVSPTQFTVTGPSAQADNFKAKRAVKVIQTTPGTGYVSSSSYNASTGLTTVTVFGIVLDSGLSAVWLGQDPANAPGDTCLRGECRLTLTGSSLLLSRYNGHRITIDNQPQVIPAGGVSLPPTGLSAYTSYYIYAYIDNGVMKLEASTGDYATDYRNGMRIKAGNQTKTLVGMARTDSTASWIDSGQNRLVLSYYNRAKKIAKSSLSSDRSTKSLEPVPLTTITETVNCLSWGDSASYLFFNFLIQGGTNGTAILRYINDQSIESSQNMFGYGGNQGCAHMMSPWVLPIGYSKVQLYYNAYAGGTARVWIGGEFGVVVEG